MKLYIDGEPAELCLVTGRGDSMPATEGHLLHCGYAPAAALQAAESRNAELNFALGKAQGEAEGHALMRKAAEVEVAQLKAELEVAWSDEHDPLAAQLSALQAEHAHLVAEVAKWREVGGAARAALVARLAHQSARPSPSGGAAPTPAKEPAKAGDGGEPESFRLVREGLSELAAVAGAQPSPPVAEPSAVGGFATACRCAKSRALCPFAAHRDEPTKPVAKPERDYSVLIAALRDLAMMADADTAPRHIAWQHLANRLERGE